MPCITSAQGGTAAVDKFRAAIVAIKHDNLDRCCRIEVEHSNRLLRRVRKERMSDRSELVSQLEGNPRSYEENLIDGKRS